MKTTEKIKKLANLYFGRENNGFRNLRADNEWNNWQSVIATTEDYLFLSSLLSKKEMIIKDVTDQDIKLEGTDGLFNFIEDLMDNYFSKLDNPKKYSIMDKITPEPFFKDFSDFADFKSVIPTPSKKKYSILKKL